MLVVHIMRSTVRFVLILTLGLAALSWFGYHVLERTNRRWFEADLSQRSRLAVTTARESLIEGVLADRARLRHILTNITHDDRVMAAAVCSPDGQSIAETESFPNEFSCGDLSNRLLSLHDRAGPSPQDLTKDLPAGPVHLSGTPLISAGRKLGTVLLVHDMSFLARRTATTRKLSIAAFFVLSMGASLITFIAIRLAWRGWMAEFRDVLAGRKTKQFQPLVTDIRALVDQLVSERSVEGHSGPWSPERLRATLTKHLHDERILLLANREPYVHEHDANTIRVLHPASGLVTALEPVMRACSGVWVAHGSGSADRETSDVKGRVLVPPGEESYAIRRVWLSEAEEQGYYYGFANEGLWPLCHVAHTRPIFRAGDWENYVAVNRRFAETVVDEADSDDPIILVQDYHFALAPKMIRTLLPRATILAFWHVPWPSSERFGICPWREEIISGLLGSSILGFHTQQHCNNFIDSVDAFMESRIDRERNAVVQRARRTLVRPYPISIEWPVRWLERIPSVEECREWARQALSLPGETMIGIGVDRLDYTKGLEERFQAVDDLMARYPEFRGRFTFVQIAAPSRTKIQRYRHLSDRVGSLARAINAKWTGTGVSPITLLCAHYEPQDVFRFFRAAELCYVSSLHDGMNLVAKEFVAARDDEQGVVVLSQFTGAARDLTEALIVNPYDIRQAADALAAALRMPHAEQRERVRSMRRLLAEFNVYRWAGRMLVDAAELRRRDRVSGRLSELQPTLRAVSA